MTFRAVIFDVYGTLLEVGPPPADAAEGWADLCRRLLPNDARLTMSGFAQAADRIVAREHSAARANGIPWPEIFWPDVVREILPGFADISPDLQAEFLYRQAALRHTVRLMDGAADTLHALQRAGVVLGIASNAQPYTLRELAEGLASGGLAPDIFTPALRVWSFEHGFSKPDPHVFRLLSARLRVWGIAASETLMVGDRLDNDVRPAAAQGWQTWHLTSSLRNPPPRSGDWAAFATANIAGSPAV